MINTTRTADRINQILHHPVMRRTSPAHSYRCSGFPDIYLYLRLIHGIIILAAVLSLLACARQITIEDRASLDNWHAHQEKLLRLGAWQLNGRMSLSVENEAWSASLYWTQERRSYQLRVIAPMGRGSFEINGDDAGVTMRLAQDQILHADNPETLLAENFGWSVPVSGLSYWIRGVPDPGTRVNELSVDNRGRINHLEQSGWQVVYSNYASHGDVELPGRIVINKDKIRLRLVIRDWLI